MASTQRLVNDWGAEDLGPNFLQTGYRDHQQNMYLPLLKLKSQSVANQISHGNLLQSSELVVIRRLRRGRQTFHRGTNEFRSFLEGANIERSVEV